MTSNKLTISAHDSYIAQLKWSADGKFLASAGGDKRIKIWNDISFSFYKEFAGHDEVISCLAWSDSNKRIASGSADKLIKIWNLEYLEEPLILRGHKEFVRDVVWANNDKQIISCSEDGLIIFWDAQTGNILQKIKNAHASGWVLSLTPVINGVFASGGGDCMVRLWNTEGKQIKLLRGHNAWVDCVKWMDNGKLIASASGDKSIRIWDVKSKRTNRIIEGHTTNIRSVAVSYDGTLLASKADENCVSVWQTKTWNSKDSLPEANGNTYWPPKIDFHPNRMALASLGAVENEFSIHEFTSDKEANAADQNESVNYIAAKIVLVGESGVGKSGLAIRLSNNEYTEQSSTHGQQFYVLNFLKKTREDGTECEAVLWDLAGQRDYRLIHGLFLDDVDLGLIVINPADTVNPLKGVAFWLRLLQYKVTRKLGSILIGGRLDRGSAAFSRFELEKFCTENQITGGYVATSARENTGMEELRNKMQTEIAWEEKTVTTTTRVFKVIKAYVLKLKEARLQSSADIIMTWKDLQKGLEHYNQEILQPEGQAIELLKNDLRTAVGHLAVHGLVRIISPFGQDSILLIYPELFHNLASSIIMLARNDENNLGAIDEQKLRDNIYLFKELADLSLEHSNLLTNAVILMFIEQHVAFREVIGTTVLLIFPELINQKKPPLPLASQFIEGTCYILKGSIHNLYGGMVVLMGYANILTRKAQWQDEAWFEFGKDEICGFKQLNEIEGELQFDLFFSINTPLSAQTIFQGLFERFLLRRDVSIVSFQPISCPQCGYRVIAAEAKKFADQRKLFIFCPNDGYKITLDETLRKSLRENENSQTIDIEGDSALSKSRFERVLSKLLSFAGKNKVVMPVNGCFISYAWEDEFHKFWVQRRLATDLKNAGINIILDEWSNYGGADLYDFIKLAEKADFVVVVGTPAYLEKSNPRHDMPQSYVRAEMNIIDQRVLGMATKSETVIPLLRKGIPDTSLPIFLRTKISLNFIEEKNYYSSLLDLLISIMRLPLADNEIIQLKEELRK